VSGAEPWSFGEAPLGDGVAFAVAARDLISAALALERPTETLRSLTVHLDRYGAGVR
jgi:hypothetical protein